jgi:hypothetical protein
MPYFWCPGCHARVHESNSYTRRVSCPVCSRVLTSAKNVPVDLDSWLADRVRHGMAHRRPDAGGGTPSGARSAT